MIWWVLSPATFLLVSTGTAGLTHMAGGRSEHFVVARAGAGLDGDGRPDRIEIQMNSGRRISPEKSPLSYVGL